MKIMLVDDMKTVHVYTKTLFSDDADFEFVNCYNGQEALDALDEGQLVDLVLLDWEMPGLTGPETLIEIKKNHPDLPVIMVTTRNSVDDMNEVREKGANEFIIKPFTKDVLLGKIEMLDDSETLSI